MLTYHAAKRAWERIGVKISPEEAVDAITFYRWARMPSSLVGEPMEHYRFRIKRSILGR